MIYNLSVFIFEFHAGCLSVCGGDRTWLADLAQGHQAKELVSDA